MLGHRGSVPRNAVATLAVVASGILLLAPGSALAGPANPSSDPVINPNGTVTFNLTAPSATSVSVTGDWGPLYQAATATLTEGTGGVWSTTIGPLTPNLYTYEFVIDGATVTDPMDADTWTSQPVPAGSAFRQGPSLSSSSLGFKLIS